MSGVKKKPESRRWKAAGYAGVLAAQERVGIEFVCGRGHDAVVVGRFFRDTSDGADGETYTEKPRPGGSLPVREGGGCIRGRMRCPRCGNDRQIRLERIAEALAAIWTPGGRRVVRYRV